MKGATRTWMLAVAEAALSASEAEQLSERSREVRQRATVIQESLKAGEMTLSEALEDGAIQNYPLERVLRWLPGVGWLRLGRILDEAAVSRHFLNQPISALTERQRSSLDCVAMCSDQGVHPHR
jgi:hypothetical protein